MDDTNNLLDVGSDDDGDDDGGVSVGDMEKIWQG